jgi:hypothetical protein
MWNDADPDEATPKVRDIAKHAAPTMPKTKRTKQRDERRHEAPREPSPSGTSGAVLATGAVVGSRPAGSAPDLGDPFSEAPAGSARVDGADESLAEDLERLAALFRSGELTVDEYADAKRRRLGKDG